jgi:hypothetical protein
MPLDPHNVLSVPEHLDSGLVRLGNHLCQRRQLPYLYDKIENLISQ